MTNLIAEAFIKEHTRDYHCGDKVVCPPAALESLIAQLIPEGSVVVPREAIEEAMTGLQHLLNHEDWPGGERSAFTLNQKLRACHEVATPGTDAREKQ